MNFLHDHARFFAMLNGFTNLDISQWGYEMFLAPPNGEPDNPYGSKIIPANGRVSRKVLEGYTLQLGGFIFTLTETIYQQHCLIGRGTLVAGAKLSKAPATNRLNINVALIIKISWPPKSRTSEQSLIEEAIAAMKQHKAPWVPFHLPQIFFTQDIENDPQGLQRKLQAFLEDAYEERVMRIVVQEALIPIAQLTTADDLLTALRGIFKCACTTLTYVLPLFTICNRL
jgi:hypothetical protein